MVICVTPSREVLLLFRREVNGQVELQCRSQAAD